jgi:hypothetical protein
MLAGAVLTSHASLTNSQAAIYALHDGHLFELLRDTTPGVLLSWVNLGEPPNTCVAYPPSVVWGNDSSAPIRVFCTTSSGRLAARLLDFNTRAPLAWENHDDGNVPTLFTAPGASVEWSTTTNAGCLAGFFPPARVSRTSLFVGATDGSLWERTRTAATLQWVDRGTPPGTCVVGEPMTDPAMVPPASPLRVFVAAASGTLFERIIDGPSGITWVDHGRPSTAAGPVSVGSGGVVVSDVAMGAVHVLMTAGATLFRLDIPTLGMPGSWTALPAPPPTVAGEDTWISSGPGGGMTVAGAATVLGEFFVVGTRRLSGGGLVGVPTDEVWHCRSDVRVAGDLTYVGNLGAPGRTPLSGTNYYLISAVRGLAAPLSRIYASSRPSQGTTESLDEWSFAPAAVGSSGLGLPPALPAPCTSASPVMNACGGPRRFTVGSAW